MADSSNKQAGGGAAPPVAGHPNDYHVSGPRSLAATNWRDQINSSWKDFNYKRMVIACFVQAVYLLELDRQDESSRRRTDQAANGLAGTWWKPFKYRLAHTLVDVRDGSIYGALLEWDRAAAAADMILVRPAGAPKAVLALRGTLLTNPSIRRDIQDDLRLLAFESLKGSVRFTGALEAAKMAVSRHGGANVCITGHSLGAGFALQIGKALAKEGACVECHLFNPPSVSVANSLRIAGEKTGLLLRRFKAAEASINGSGKISSASEGRKKWMPHLYVNNSDYICCYYSTPDESSSDGKINSHGGSEVPAKLFVTSNGPQKFLQAHALQQWWSDDIELQEAIHQSKLINWQLRSLYAAAPLKNHLQ